MEIRIKGTYKEDFPNYWNVPIKDLEDSVRRRLELRPQDKVVFDIK